MNEDLVKDLEVLGIEKDDEIIACVVGVGCAAGYSRCDQQYSEDHG